MNIDAFGWAMLVGIPAANLLLSVYVTWRDNR